MRRQDFSATLGAGTKRHYAASRVSPTMGGDPAAARRSRAFPASLLLVSIDIAPNAINHLA
jgi:hypothetical protein